MVELKDSVKDIVKVGSMVEKLGNFSAAQLELYSADTWAAWRDCVMAV